MIFGNPSFYFSDQVGSHISCFCINTATHTGKQCNRGSTKRKPGQYLNDLSDFPSHVGVYQIQDTQSEQTQAHNSHTHHRPSCKGYFKCLTQTGPGSVGGANIGLSSHFHTDKSSQC